MYLNRDISLAGSSFSWPGRRWEKGREKERQKKPASQGVYFKGQEAQEAQSCPRVTGAAHRGFDGSLGEPSCLNIHVSRCLTSLSDITRCAPGEETHLSVLNEQRIQDAQIDWTTYARAFKRPPTAASLIIKSHSR